MSDFLSDLRYAARGLLRRPGFAIAAVLLLGIGIGASSVLLTLARATFAQQPPHVAQPERLVRLNRTSEGVTAGSLSYPDYEFYRDENHTLSSLAAYDRSLIPIMARTGDAMTQVSAGLVSGTYFHVLGVQPALGRLIRREDDRGVGGPQVAVISHDLWTTMFGGRPDVVGGQFTLGAAQFQVIGVAPAGFHGVSLAEPAPDVWVPITLQPVVASGEGNRLRRVPGESEFWVDAVGRLRPGVGVEAAAADLSTLAVRLEQEFAEWSAGSGVRVSADARFHPNLRRRMVRVMGLLGAATATILIIACLNVALLLLARGAARGREMGIRRAIGARQTRIVRQLLTEGLLLAVVGAALGMGLAVWISRTAGAALFTSVMTRFQPDLGVVGLTALVAIISVLVFALGPALVAARPAIVEVLKTGGGSRRGGRLRSGLVVTQIALSLALVTAAGLLVRSILSAQAVELGFSTERQLLVSVDLERAGYTEARGKAFIRDALDHLAALPGVRAATTTYRVPFRGMWSTGFRAEGVTPPTGSSFESGANAVGAGYFSAMGIPMVAGREFAPSDDDQAPLVAIVNQTLARTVWGDADPVGRVIGDGDRGRATVVGVARDAHYYDLGETPQSQLYLPTLQHYRPGLYFLIRAVADPAGLTTAVVSQLRAIDPSLVVGGATTLASVVDAEVRPLRTIAITVSAVGVVALLLAALGLYGVLAYLVTQRTREFGIRMALGAPQGRVARDVVRYGARLAAGGIVVGLIGAWVGTRLARSFLFGIETHDPVTFTVAPLALAVVALAASFVPARRAGEVNPMEALRHE